MILKIIPPRKNWSCFLSRALAGRRTIGIFLSSVFTLLLVLPQDGADAVNISGHHRQGHITLEATDAMIRAPVQSMDFERVDRRFNRRVRAPRFDERFGLLRGLRGVR